MLTRPSQGVSNTWTYTWTTNTTGGGDEPDEVNVSVNVAKPDGNDEEDTFPSIRYSATSSQSFYQGHGPHNPNGGSGTLLETQLTTRQVITTPFFEPLPPLPPSGVSPPPNRYSAPWEFQILEAGAQTQKTTTYSDGSTSQEIDTPTPATTVTYENPGENLDQNDRYSDGRIGTAASIQFGQEASIAEYDIGNPQSSSPGALLRTTTNTYKWNSGDSQAPSYLAANLVDLMASSVTTDGTGAWTAETDYGYDANNGSPQGAIGNLTSINRVNHSGPSIQNQTVFNSQGMPTLTTDSNGNQISVASYQCSGLFPKQVVAPYQSATTLAEITSYVFDCSIGKITAATDPNNQTTTYLYNDPLARLTEIKSPDGGDVQAVYNDIAGATSVSLTTQLGSGTPSIESKVLYDGIGRPIQTQLTSDPAGADLTDTTYDPVGRVASVSNPHRSTSSSTDGFTSYVYDGLGRKTMQCQPDNASPSSPVCALGASYQSWNYTGNTIVFRDENGHKWTHVSDALGRLTKTLEPDSHNGQTIETDYAYDALDNLTQVDQWGGPSGNAGDRVRHFNYDNLSRLLSSTNPESGTIGYSYDGDSNVHTKTDARGIVTTYSYDPLNRLTGKSYTNDPSNTPSVSYTYDAAQAGWNFVNQTSPAWPGGVQQTNLIGRLSYAASGSAATVYGYDALGRTTLKSVCTPTTCGTDHYDMHAKYDLAGNTTFSDLGLDAVQNAASPNTGYYYGGLQVAYNGAGQAVSGTADIVDATHPAAIVSGLQYSPLGGMTAAAFGSAYTESNQYSSRGWLTSRTGTIPSIGYSRVGALMHDPVGNVSQLTDSYSNATSLYGMDQLNRLTSYSGPFGAATYGYDTWGNLVSHTNTAGPGYTYSLTLTPQNQVSQTGSTDSAFLYDAAGNVLADGLNNYSYDAEGRIILVNGSTGYLYGPEGDRVATLQSGAVTAEYLYGMDGTLTTELAPGGKFVRGLVYGAGMHLADYMQNGKTVFHLADEVGSLVNTIDQTGAPIESCAANPFGESLNCSPSVDYTENHFTDKKRDQESGLDYFRARYYGSTFGRFMSPDDRGGHLDDPQTLNKYVYARDNPLIYVDPDGHDFNLTGCGRTNSANCQNNQIGKTTYADGRSTFTATVIGNENKDGTGSLVDKTTGTGTYTASVNGSGVHFSNDGGQGSSSGTFINGTPKTSFQDAGFANKGAFLNFGFTFNNSKLEANQSAAGTFSFPGTPEEAGAALQQAGFTRGPGIEGGVEYRSSGSFLTGANAGHFILNPNILLDPGVSVPAAGGSMHFGEHNVYGGIGGAGMLLHCVSDRAGYCQ